MDLTKLLPLLSGDEKTASLLEGLAGGDKTSFLTAALGNKNPNVAKILGLMSAVEKKPPSKKKSPLGLKAVAGFATSDIIGRLYKLLK